MDRTPSGSRSSSRSSLEDHAGNDSKELETKTRERSGVQGKGKGASVVPSTSHRPLQRAGTWTKAYVAVESGSLASSDPSITPRAKQGKPVRPEAGHASGTGSLTSASTSSSALPPSSSTGVAPAKKGIKDNRVFASDLSPKLHASLWAALQAEAGLSPEKLGELLVAVESKGGANKLEGDAIRRILRGALQVRDFSLPSGDSRDINVIKQICEPFMFRHLASPALEKARKKFISEFDKVAGKFALLAQEVPQKEWTRSDRMTKLTGSAMGPVVDLICGKENSLDSSALPDPVKKLLMAIDKYVIDWFGKNGTGKPADLLEARKSALIGFLSTRSLGYVWLTKSREEKAIDERHLTLLMAYMNAYVSKGIDGFVMDLILRQPDQPVEARKYIEVLTKKSGLKSKPTVPKLALGKGADAKMLSPRLTGISATSRADAGSTTPVKAEEKREKERMMKMKLERARLVDRLADASGLKDIDYPCYQYVKDVVVNMSRRGFDHFQQDPAKSFVRHADKFYARLENHQKVRDGLPDKVRNAFQALALRMVGNPFEDDGAEALRTPAPPSVRRPATEKEESSTTESSDETEVVTESSEDGKRS